MNKMLRLRSEITINKTTFNAVVSVEIESSWENLTDTCRVELPNNFKRDGRPITVGDEGFFKRGDAVLVKLGYFPNLNTEFEGFIRNIYVDNVIVIDCEDAAFLLKQKTVIKSFASTTLKNLLTEISPIEFEAVESYIRDGVLLSGLAYYNDGTQHNFSFEENIIENNLEQISNDELLITVYGSSQQKDNSVIEVFGYYEDGEVVTSTKDPEQGELEKLTIKSEISQKDLEFYVKNKLEQRLSTATLGEFTAFGEPAVKHGDTVNLISGKFPEREGVFLVRKVVKSFGLGGFRQTITLHTKIKQ
jgi:hypothetical protein